MRRTFQDLARAAGVEGIITRSICGHTPDMTELYSSVNGGEQRASIGRVISLFARDPHATQAATGERGGEQPLGGGEHRKKAS